MAALFIADIERFATRIAYRIVVPGSEAELMGILGPGIRRSTLRDDGSEVRVRQDIHPGRRRYLILRCRNDILAAIRRESAQSVEENQIAVR